jgi:exopolysaccharide production protein ExoZ
MSKLRDLQSLRAVAALLVVLDHALGLAAGHGIPVEPGTSFALFAGAQGVAIFFIISGFIMTYTAEPDQRATPGTRATRFALRRIIRVVPLYWLFTALIAASALILSLYRPVTTTGAGIIKSFLFIPYRDGGGNMTPVLPIGWTLNYEMLFYALFTGLLFFSVHWRTLVLIFVLVSSVFVGAHFYPLGSGANPHSPGAFITSPVVLLFGAGALLGWLKLRWPTAHLRVQGLLLVAPLLILNLAIYAIVGHPTPVPTAWYTLFWPIDLLAVAACVFTVSPARPRLEAIGDASYSLYLVHLIPLFLGYFLWQKLHFIAPAVFVLVSLATATAAGLLCFRWIESPLTRRISTFALGPRSPRQAALAQPCTPPANPL